MATGFIYTVSTLTKDYVQQAFCNVPTQFGDRLYFGPCKVPMRPRSTPAITSSGYPLRGSVPAESCSLATSRSGTHSGKPTSGFQIFVVLKAPSMCGPSVIRTFPRTARTHTFQTQCTRIAGRRTWRPWTWMRSSSASPQTGCVGRWLGRFGPKIDGEILDFLNIACPYVASPVN